MLSICGLIYPINSKLLILSYDILLNNVINYLIVVEILILMLPTDNGMSLGFTGLENVEKTRPCANRD